MSQSANVSPIHLWCLHGNLQQPSVWETALGDLWQAPAIRVIPVDLWSTTAQGFWDWAELFCERVVTEGASRNVVLGYSLGGRLALHAVLHNPELWEGAIATSTSPGLSSFQDRQACLQRDRIWGQRFRTEPWQALLNEWDNLPVFNDIPCSIEREESQFSRQRIARLFDIFSQGRQEDLSPYLKALENLPILYISGELDRKYCTIGRRLAEVCGGVEWVAIANAGHRVPWENTPVFMRVVKQWLRQLSD